MVQDSVCQQGGNGKEEDSWGTRGKVVKEALTLPVDVRLKVDWHDVRAAYPAPLNDRKEIHWSQPATIVLSFSVTRQRGT